MTASLNIREQAAADSARRSLADSGVACTYTPPGGSPAAVRACFASAEVAPARPRREGAAQTTAAPGPTQAKRKFRVLVASLELDADLGVAALQAGGAFAVPGSAVGRPADGTVRLVVALPVGCVAGQFWTAEVHT